MISLFAIPKAFRGPIADAQDNTLGSWRRLHPDVQILLFGDDEGVAEAARRHGAEHVAEVARNQFGTPLLDDAFRVAQARARHRCVAYANADIVFGGDLLRALDAVALSSFLLVGRRTNLDVVGRLDFADPRWAETLRARARREGSLYSPMGIDYFVFPRGLVSEMPAFPVGRALWDNWMIHDARRRGVPVIDATQDVLAVHQNHDYGHIAGGSRAAWYGDEVKRNWEMLGPDFLPFTIDDATWTLEGGRCRPARDLRHLARRVLMWPALDPRLKRSVRVARALKRALGV
jgi:hypothetical protein